MASQAAVARGLGFLLRMQHADGGWRLDDTRFPDSGISNDVAGTAFALLPFLAEGVSQNDKDDKGAAVKKGLQFLVKRQQAESGMLDAHMYAHSIAALALCEAYALTRDENLRGHAQKAIDYLVAAQHDEGGWRYEPKQGGDTSSTGWAVQALDAGRLAGLTVPATTFKKASRFLDRVCDFETEGYGYTRPTPTATLTAVGLWCRQRLNNWSPRNPRMQKGLDHVTTPGPDAKNMYFSYYAAQVLFHHGGPQWEKWNVPLRDELIKAQEGGRGELAGSWPVGKGLVSGRLMQTSLSLLTLQVYYRHTPLFPPAAKD